MFLTLRGMGFFSFRLQPEEAVDQEASHVLMLRASAVIPEAQAAKKGGVRWEVMNAVDFFVWQGRIQKNTMSLIGQDWIEKKGPANSPCNLNPKVYGLLL